MESKKLCGGCENFWPITNSGNKDKKKIQGDCCSFECPYRDRVVWKSYPACNKWEEIKPIHVDGRIVPNLEELEKLEK